MRERVAGIVRARAAPCSVASGGAPTTEGTTMGRGLHDVRDELYGLDHAEQLDLLRRVRVREEHLERLEVLARLERIADEHAEMSGGCGICGDIRADNLEVDLYWHPRAALDALAPAIP
jgi:hypothetical protein